MVLSVLLAVIGLAILAVAADQLVLGGSRIASWLGISPVMIGVVVIGLGTSSPEFVASGLAAAHGDTDLAIGTLTGSNLLNLSLILGLVATVGEIRVSATVIRREVRLAVAAVVGFAIVVWLGLTVWTAVVLLIALLAAVWMLGRWAHIDQPAPCGSQPPGSRPRRDRRSGAAEITRAGLGLAGLLLGAELLVGNAADIAARLGIAPSVIGFTVLALGTSLPELVTAVAAQRRGEPDLVVGNLFGSNLFNSLAGGAIVGFANGQVVHHTATAALIAMGLGAVLAWAIILRGRRVTRPEGALLLTLYLLSIPLVVAGPTMP